MKAIQNTKRSFRRAKAVRIFTLCSECLCSSVPPLAQLNPAGLWEGRWKLGVILKPAAHSTSPKGFTNVPEPFPPPWTYQTLSRCLICWGHAVGRTSPFKSNAGGWLILLNPMLPLEAQTKTHMASSRWCLSCCFPTAALTATDGLMADFSIWKIHSHFRNHLPPSSSIYHALQSRAGALPAHTCSTGKKDLWNLGKDGNYSLLEQSK